MNVKLVLALNLLEAAVFMNGLDSIQGSRTQDSLTPEQWLEKHNNIDFIVRKKRQTVFRNSQPGQRQYVQGYEPGVHVFLENEKDLETLLANQTLLDIINSAEGNTQQNINTQYYPTPANNRNFQYQQPNAQYQQPNRQYQQSNVQYQQPNLQRVAANQKPFNNVNPNAATETILVYGGDNVNFSKDEILMQIESLINPTTQKNNKVVSTTTEKSELPLSITSTDFKKDNSNKGPSTDNRELKQPSRNSSGDRNASPPNDNMKSDNKESDNDRRPFDSKRPSDYDREPDYDRRPSDFDRRPPDYDRRPSDNDRPSSDFDRRRPEYDRRPPDYDRRPPDYDRRPYWDSDYDRRPHYGRPRGWGPPPYGRGGSGRGGGKHRDRQPPYVINLNVADKSKNGTLQYDENGKIIDNPKHKDINPEVNETPPGLLQVSPVTPES